MKLDILLEGIQDKWTFKAVFLIGGPGCLAPGTKIVMFDGSLKKVENIQVNDLLMGPDSKPRTVLNLINNEGNLYKIKQSKNNDYIVNEDHILSLKKSIRAIKRNRYPEYNELINISVKDYINKSKTWKRNFYGWRSDIIFKKNNISIDPYFLGLWLGYGTKHKPSIITEDSEIKEYLIDFANDIDQNISINKNGFGNANEYNIINKGKKNNRLKNKLKEYDLINNKHIPNNYLINSKKIRYELLAGILDADGSLKGNCFDLVQKKEKLSYQIKFLCNSLGLRCNINKCWKVNTTTKKGDWYYRMTISGNTNKIPTKTTRKKVIKYNKRVNFSICSIKIIPEGIGEYFGFELDKDGLFLLEDFSVTHNSGKNFMAKKLLHSFKNIDPDRIRELLMKKYNIPFDASKRNKEQQEKFYGEVDKQSKEKSNKLYHIIIERRLPILLNYIGTDYNSTAKSKNKLESLGYETKMIYAFTSLKQAIKRNFSRQRKLGKSELQDLHDKAVANIEKFRKLFGSNFTMIDNSQEYKKGDPDWELAWLKISKWMEKPVINAAAKEWKEKQKKK